MPTAIFTAYQSADTAVAGSSMNALANGSWALGSAIDNSTLRYPFGDIELVLSSAVSAGSGSPVVEVYLLPSADGGTTYPTPPGGSAGTTPAGYWVGNIIANASANFTSGLLQRVDLTPGFFRIEIRNQLGVAFPSTNTSTLKLYRYSLQS